ncbi:MAG: hypothetical protein AAFX93_16395 [Verrucomicrobiota bacterium]
MSDATIKNSQLDTTSGGSFTALSGTLESVSVAGNIILSASTNQIPILKGTIRNDGVIQLVDDGSGYIGLDGEVTLNGSGAMTFVSSHFQFDYYAKQNKIINEAGHTLDGRISIDIPFDNHGLFDANASGEYSYLLAPYAQDTDQSTNTGVIQASNGAMLAFEPWNMDSAGGTIQAVGANSIVDITSNDAYIPGLVGGEFQTSGGGVIKASRTTLKGFTNHNTLAIESRYVPNPAFPEGRYINTITRLGGVVTNNGTISVARVKEVNDPFEPGGITVDEILTLNSSGELIIKDALFLSGHYDSDQQRNDFLINSANHTVRVTDGVAGLATYIGPYITNHGTMTFEADVNWDPELDFSLIGSNGIQPNTVINQGLIQVHNGALVTVKNTEKQFNNSNGLVTATGADSILYVTDDRTTFHKIGLVTGGEFDADNGGRVINNVTFQDFTNSGIFENTPLASLQGMIQNNGEILINDPFDWENNDPFDWHGETPDGNLRALSCPTIAPRQ